VVFEEVISRLKLCSSNEDFKKLDAEIDNELIRSEFFFRLNNLLDEKEFMNRDFLRVISLQPFEEEDYLKFDLAINQFLDLTAIDNMREEAMDIIWNLLDAMLHCGVAAKNISEFQFLISKLNAQIRTYGENHTTALIEQKINQFGPTYNVA